RQKVHIAGMPCGKATQFMVSIAFLALIALLFFAALFVIALAYSRRSKWAALVLVAMVMSILIPTAISCVKFAVFQHNANGVLEHIEIGQPFSQLEAQLQSIEDKYGISLWRRVDEDFVTIRFKQGNSLVGLLFQ